MISAAKPTDLTLSPSYDTGISRRRDVGSSFLNALKSPLEKGQVGEDAYIISHMDSDGLAAALIGRHLLAESGYNIPYENIFFLDHLEVPKVLEELNEKEPLILFTDIRPRGDLPKNGFCIDHHQYGRGSLYNKKYFIYYPQTAESFPSCAALVAAYLYYLQQTEDVEVYNFQQFCSNGVWADVEHWLNREKIKKDVGRSNVKEAVQKM